MARCLLLMVGVTFVVVWLSAIQGVDSKCANHCKKRCNEISSRQRLPRVPCYIRCRKLAATCKSCSGPRWCFKCSPGYLLTTEPRCVFNECRRNNGGCDADATCSNAMNRFGGISFKCECNSGFNGDGRSCTDVDECQTNNGGCSDNGDTGAICSNTIGSFTCSCSDGFTEEGTSCIDINECRANHGGCRDNGDTNAVCLNNRGSFTCKCGTGFTSVGTSCNDKDECVTNNGGCRYNGDINAVCVNNIGSFTCNCSIGFTFNGSSCVDVNECVTNNGGCRDFGDINAVCVNNLGSFTCNCSTGFTSDGTSCKGPPVELTSKNAMDSGVTALTSYGDFLYIATIGDIFISVFDARKLQFLKTIYIPQGSGVYYGLVLSPTNDCIYVTDYGYSIVFKVSLNNQATLNSWSVPNKPRGISMNHLGNLLVVGESNTISEYDSDGGSVRSTTVTNKLGGVRGLSDDKLAVTAFGPTLYGVAVINSNNGSVQYSYGSTRGSATGQMSSPYAMTSNSQNYWLVADYDNDQIYVLNPTLSQARALPLTLSPGLRGPGSIWLDESRGFLFVGELEPTYRILLFSNVNYYNLVSALAN